jgi:hypothetical protein
MKLAYLAAVLTASATMLMSNGVSAQGYNYRNSPYNYNNSKTSNDGTYNNQGNRQGYAVRPSNVVFVGGQYIGQDPDAHVRAILRRDYSGHLGN